MTCHALRFLCPGVCMILLVQGCRNPPGEPTIATPETTRTEVSTWGAVFWREGQPWGMGPWSHGADLAPTLSLNPEGVSAMSTPSTPTGPCGAHPLSGPPGGAVITVPPGSTPPTLPPRPVAPAGMVEAAAWRLDEVLPPSDAFTPGLNAKDPARQRGVVVGSVLKTRQAHAPPLIVATGTRDCHGAVVVLDHTARKVLGKAQIDGVCGDLQALPVTDLNGDGEQDLVVHGDTVVARYVLDDARGLSPRDLWTCPETTP